MNEIEVVQEIARRTALPEPIAQIVFETFRDLFVEGAIDGKLLRGEPAAQEKQAPAAEANPHDPHLVEQLIASARRHPLGVQFLISGLLASVAIAFGVHAFTVEAARAKLRRENAETPEEPIES